MTYMGGQVEPVEAPNGAIATKRILDGIEEVAWLKPTIEQPVEGVWVFGGYGLVPISIIDTKHGDGLLLEAVRTVTDKPVKYVVYSHNHHDPISSGNIFKEEGATFIGHENILKQLGDHPIPVIPLPDITFDESYTLALGGRTLELIYFEPNQTMS